MVTPFAGVWIETIRPGDAGRQAMSLPSRECGLKLKHGPVTSISLKPGPANSPGGILIEMHAVIAGIKGVVGAVILSHDACRSERKDASHIFRIGIHGYSLWMFWDGCS
jgi:hypothetical protein